MYTAEKFEDKKELTKYAQDKYGIKLDGRLSMDDLLDGLNAAAKGSQGDTTDEGTLETSNPESKPEEGALVTPDVEPPQAVVVTKKPSKIVYRDDVVGKALRLLRYGR